MFNTRFLFLTSLLLVALISLAGCNGDQKSDEDVPVSTADQALPAGHSSDDHAGHSHASDPSLVSGKIIETMDGGTYSYVHLDRGEDKVWLAGPLTKGLEAGTSMYGTLSVEMKDFTASSLDRTFESILFLNDINIGEPPAAGHAAGGGMAGMGQGGGMAGMGAHPQTAAGPEAVVDIAKAEGGYTVAELYGQAAELAGKTIKLRAQVVKATPVMGTNYIHVQDGSGDAATCDLTVITDTAVRANDVILLEGVLLVNAERGMQQKYPILLENPTITKE